MPRRPMLPADTSPADLLAWIANAVSEAFTTPRVLPLMRRPPAEPAPPLPSLFECLPDQRPGEPAPAMAAPEREPVAKPREEAVPLEVLMRRIVGDAIGYPTALATKRRQLRNERAEKAAAAREAEAVEAQKAPEAPGPSAEDIAYVQAAILDILPKGWPSYASEVLRIRKDRGVWICRLLLFDGEIGKLRFSGQPGAHGYGWELGARDKRAFHFDEAAWAWVRIDEPPA